MSDVLTLPLDLEALHRLSDPADVLEDARSWATHAGAVSDAAPERISEFASRADDRLDFAETAPGVSGGLGVLGQQYPTWRHVVVGTADGHRTAAHSNGWEYLGIEETAEKAEWELDGADGRWRDTRDPRTHRGPRNGAEADGDG